jgi:Uma2 family endonuclease
MGPSSDPHPSDLFPKAPTQAAWDGMTAAERLRVADSLPNSLTEAEVSPPEGTLHFEGKIGAMDELRRFFRKTGRRAFFACELAVYYPGAPRFAPDLLGVLDVEDHHRGKWLVSAEGKGLDFVLEVHVGGDRKKDAVRNVAFYASLGIPEYFVYDRARGRLLGYRLVEGAKSYRPILPQAGHYESSVLGLELLILDGRHRFFYGEALVPDVDDRIRRLESLVSAIEAARDEEAEKARAEAEKARAEAEKSQAAEERVRALELELERLRRGG